jgi:hypothetical protein
LGFLIRTLLKLGEAEAFETGFYITTRTKKGSVLAAESASVMLVILGLANVATSDMFSVNSQQGRESPKSYKVEQAQIRG